MFWRFTVAVHLLPACLQLVLCACTTARALAPGATIGTLQRVHSMRLVRGARHNCRLTVLLTTCVAMRTVLLRHVYCHFVTGTATRTACSPLMFHWETQLCAVADPGVLQLRVASHASNVLPCFAVPDNHLVISVPQPSPSIQPASCASASLRTGTLKCIPGSIEQYMAHGKEPAHCASLAASRTSPVSSAHGTGDVYDAAKEMHGTRTFNCPRP